MRKVVSMALLLSASLPLAGQQVTLPAKAPPNPTLSDCGEQLTFAAYAASRVQNIWDMAEIPLSFALWGSIRLRPPGPLIFVSPTGNPAQVTTLNLTMSASNNSFATPSASFASNLGPFQTTVLTGQVSLPSVVASSTISLSAPWLPPITFNAPFVYVGTGNGALVVDMTTGVSAAAAWWLEQWVTASNGEYAINVPPQTTCKFAGGQHQYGVWYVAPPVPGKAWNLGYLGVPPGALGVAALGTRGSGAAWLGMTLPIDLTSLGAPGCVLGVALDVTLPIVANTGGAAFLPTLQIPPSPAVDLQVFYDQGIFLDPAANALGVVTGTSSRWRVGGPRSGTRVSAVGSGGWSTGTVDTSHTTVMQLN